MNKDKGMKKVDIIVSCYNEEKNIRPFYNEIKKYLVDGKYEYNIVFVNDGSVDGTYDEILKVIADNNRENASDKKKNIFNINISVISFVHNFGHEAAMCVGIDKSSADYMIIMDVDLQNPPNKIPDILEAFEKGADLVLLKKLGNKSATLLKKFTSVGYYAFSKYILLNKNEQNVSDFFAIDKNLANVIKTKYRTTLRYLRGFVQNEAKNKVILDYEAGKRFFGESKYNYIKLMKLAMSSELSRFRFFRDKYKESDSNKIYLIDEQHSKY